MKTKLSLHSALLGSAIAAASLSVSSHADFVDDAIKGGKSFGDLRLRYENVDNGSNNEALTLRTRLGFETAPVGGLSVLAELEDVRPVLGMEEQGNGIPDPDEPMTEIDQAFVQYKNDMVTGKIGRQVITLDGHRHVGHVGWRQDRQTFDAGRVIVSPVKGLKIDLSHVYRVNRINSPPNGEAQTGGQSFGDVSNTDHTLINVSYNTPVGKLVGYSYSLSEDGLYDETETLGLSFAGNYKINDDFTALYHVEFAQQDNKTSGVEPDYSLYELGLKAAGVTAKVGVEALGSDTSGSTTENFVTPLATVHKFQGWADVFLGGSLFGNIDGGNGVEDTYFSVGSKVAGIKLLAVYHDYESEGGSADLGDEINLLAVKGFGKRYSVGLKYADYSAGDSGSDVEKTWVWVGMKI